MKKILAVPLAMALLALTSFAQDQVPSKAEERIQREVRHELLMLPYYTVFDSLSYEVHGYDVILRGEVTRPVLKTDAENAVKRIEGVEHVENDIEVLPPSPDGSAASAAIVSGDLRVSATAEVCSRRSATDTNHREERACDAGGSHG